MRGIATMKCSVFENMELVDRSSDGSEWNFER